MKTITVRFDRQSGQAVKPVHGICNGPLSESGLIDTSAFYEEIGIPFIRLHDTDTPTSRTLVDISRIFPNFDATGWGRNRFIAWEKALITAFSSGTRGRPRTLKSGRESA